MGILVLKKIEAKLKTSIYLYDVNGQADYLMQNEIHNTLKLHFLNPNCI